jgi:ATP synthase protein I
MPKTDEVVGIGEADRLDALQRRIAEARGGQPKPAEPSTGADDGGAPIGRALRLGTEMAAALMVALAIGWGLDRWLGTRPIMVIVFFCLGIAAGVLNVFRTVYGVGYAVGYKKLDAGGDADDKK